MFVIILGGAFATKLIGSRVFGEKLCSNTAELLYHCSGLKKVGAFVDLRRFLGFSSTFNGGFKRLSYEKAEKSNARANIHSILFELGVDCLPFPIFLEFSYKNVPKIQF